VFLLVLFKALLFPPLIVAEAVGKFYVVLAKNALPSVFMRLNSDLGRLSYSELTSPNVMFEPIFLL